MAKKIAKAPVEWVDGKIVLRAPPANPYAWLDGKIILDDPNDYALNGNKRSPKEILGLEITESLFNWFYKHLEDRHKTIERIYDYHYLDPVLRMDGLYHMISPEAYKLLKNKFDFWEERAREDSKLRREQKKQEMEGGDFETPPEWIRNKIVLLKPAQSPNKIYYWKPNFNGENYKAVLWFRDHLPKAHQGQIIDPNNLYTAKTMSTEAGELWFKHKGFWMAQYYIPIKKKEAQKKELVSAGQEALKKASAKAGIPLKELKQKLERLSTLAKSEDVGLAIRMVEDFDDVWLFESLLAGTTIDKDGYLISGKPLKMFKEHGEFFGVLALVNAPKNTNLHASMNKNKLRYFKINDPVLKMLDLYGKHITKKCPNLRGTGNRNFDELEILSVASAEVLNNHDGGLSLNGLNTLSDAAAEILSKHKGDLALWNLTSPSDTALEAFSKHQGKLDLGGLTSLSDAAAELLSKHKGDLSLGGLTSLNDSSGHIALARKLASQKGDLWLNDLKSLSDGAAKALSKHKGQLLLDGLESLSAAAGNIALAKKLAVQKAKFLSFSGLKSLSNGAAKALSKYKGQIWRLDSSLKRKVAKFKNQAKKND